MTMGLTYAWYTFHGEQNFNFDLMINPDLAQTDGNECI